MTQKIDTPQLLTNTAYRDARNLVDYYEKKLAELSEAQKSDPQPDFVDTLEQYVILKARARHVLQVAENVWTEALADAAFCLCLTCSDRPRVSQLRPDVAFPCPFSCPRRDKFIELFSQTGVEPRD